MNEKIIRSEGINQSENRLAKLGEKIFFGLWSYPNLYYKSGKELADLLIICGEYVLIFSDKNIKFNPDKTLEVAWIRWHKKAILASINQLRMAGRSIRNFPDKIFLDPKCTNKLSIIVPKQSEMKVHSICVANGIEKACSQYFNDYHREEKDRLLRNGDPSVIMTEKILEDLPEGSSSGSLMFDSCQEKGVFRITDYDKSKTFVHVFNDYTFTFVLDELDTLKDFVSYLAEKERFIRKIKWVTYTGEENLLFNYVKNFDTKRNCHTFVDTAVDTAKVESVHFLEENWNKLRETPHFKKKKEADEVSYMWDAMIQNYVRFALDGVIVRKYGSGLLHDLHEGAVRYMALEDRVHRRYLSATMKRAIESYPEKLNSCVNVYYICDSSQAYVFLQMKKLQNVTYEQYRKARQDCLQLYANCLKAKLVSEHSKIRIDRIIGHGMEPPKIAFAQGDSISDDFVLLDCTDWSDEQQTKVDSIRKDMNILVRESETTIAKEYPKN